MPFPLLPWFGLFFLGTSVEAPHGGQYRGPGAVVPPGYSAHGPRRFSLYRSWRRPALGSWAHAWEFRKEETLFAALEDAGRTALQPGVVEHCLHLIRDGVSSPNPDVRAASLIALGRASRGERDLAPLVAGLLDVDPFVREAAILGLGLLGRREAWPLLRRIARSGSLFGGLDGAFDVSRERSRVFACFAAGLLVDRCGDPRLHRSVAVEMAGLLGPSPASPGLRQAAVLVLGMAGRLDGGRWIPPIEGVLADPRSDGRVRGQAALSLVSMLRPAAPEEQGNALADTLLRWLDDPAFPRAARCASLEALARLVPSCSQDRQQAALRQWRAALAAEGHPALPGSSALAMARCAAALDGDDPLHLAIVESLEAGLVSARLELRSWFAFALGLLSFEQAGLPPAVATRRRALLRSGVSSMPWELEPGAWLLALGLLQDPEVEGLLGRLQRPLDSSLRYGALAMGIAGTPSAPFRRSLVLDSPRQPRLQLQALLGLGFGSDPAGTACILQAVRREDSGRAVLAVLASWSTALGMRMDHRALPELSLLARAPHPSSWQPQLVQAYAVATLGILADREGGPWCRLFTREIHFFSRPVPFHDQRGSGVLDLL